MTRSNPIQFSAGQRVTLAFRARWWYVDNPTGSTVYLREGNTDIPSGIASADMFVPALSARVIPCNASEFGLGFGTPVSTAPAGLPTSAVALFGDESEPMPSIGSEAALSTVVSGAVTVGGTVTSIPPGATLLDSRSFASAGAKTYNVAIPTGTQALILEIGSNTHGLFNDLTVVGQQTGIVYYGGKTAPLSDELPIYMPIVVPIYSPSDAGVTIAFTYNSATGSSWLVYSLTGQAPPTLGAGGAQMVREYPAPLAGAAQGHAFAPAANTVLASVAAPTAGEYAVEYRGGTDDGVGVGKALWLSLVNPGETIMDVAPAPGGFRDRIERLTMAAGDIVRVRCGGAAGGAGAIYGAQIRLYRIA